LSAFINSLMRKVPSNRAYSIALFLAFKIGVGARDSATAMRISICPCDRRYMVREVCRGAYGLDSANLPALGIGNEVDERLNILGKSKDTGRTEWLASAPFPYFMKKAINLLTGNVHRVLNAFVAQVVNEWGKSFLKCLYCLGRLVGAAMDEVT
jgi:hypothetical protein